MSKELNNNNKPNCRTAFAMHARGQKCWYLIPFIKRVKLDTFLYLSLESFKNLYFLRNKPDNCKMPG